MITLSSVMRFKAYERVNLPSKKLQAEFQEEKALR